jgi:uncharacterized protein (TIGR02117 family)
MKRFRRICQYSLGTVFAIPMLLGLGYIIPTRLGRSPQAPCALDNQKIYVVGDITHTNIIVPVRNEVFDWGTYLNLQSIGSDTEANYQYLAFGWGEREFYMNTPTPADFRWSNALRALLLINQSVLYVQGLPTAPTLDANTRCVRLSQANYLNLMQFIHRTFEQTPQGNKIRLQNGYTSNGGFYAAKGRYSILRTCNNWTAEGLRTAEVNTPLWAGLAPAVMFHLPKSCQCEKNESLE